MYRTSTETQHTNDYNNYTDYNDYEKCIKYRDEEDFTDCKEKEGCKKIEDYNNPTDYAKYAYSINYSDYSVYTNFRDLVIMAYKPTAVLQLRY